MSLDALESLAGFDLTQRSVAQLACSFPVWELVEGEVRSFGAAKSISAFGLLQPENHRVLIEELDWIGGKLEIALEARLQNGARIWHDLVFDSADVMRCWPPEPVVPAGIALPKAIAEPDEETAEKSTVPASSGASGKLAFQPTETLREWTRRQFDAGATQEQAFQQLRREKDSGRHLSASRERLRSIYRDFDPSRGPGRRPRHTADLD